MQSGRRDVPRDSRQIAEELLVLRAQVRDAWAFEQLYHRFRLRLLGHARALTGSLDAAEDVSQEVWIAIARGLWRLADPLLFRAWAFRITTHKAADWVRREARREALHAEVRSQAPEQAQGGEAGHGQPSERVREALAELSPEHRAVTRLHYLERLSVAEIAAALKIPAGTVKSRLFHSRRRLEQALLQNRPERTRP